MKDRGQVILKENNRASSAR